MKGGIRISVIIALFSSSFIISCGSYTPYTTQGVSNGSPTASPSCTCKNKVQASADDSQNTVETSNTPVPSPSLSPVESKSPVAVNNNQSNSLPAVKPSLSPSPSPSPGSSPDSGKSKLARFWDKVKNIFKKKS